MFSPRRAELRRILQENKDLKARVRELEGELREERESSRRMVLELTNRVLTAAGCYALPKEIVEKRKQPVEATTKAQTPELTAMEEAIRDAYRQDRLASGGTIQEADAMFARRMRGEKILSDEEEFTLPS